MERTNVLRVTLDQDGCFPVTFRWQGRTVRVLSVEGARLSGLERRYCVRTVEGRYELNLHLGTGAWQMRRSPGWLSRAWARARRMPRYPLPAWQRRARGRPAGSQSAGGAYALRLALVRQ